MKKQTVHPDDAYALNDWPNFGPRNSEIAAQVGRLCDRGIRLDYIEQHISRALLELERQQDLEDNLNED
jgi:hypothetical protein